MDDDKDKDVSTNLRIDGKKVADLFKNMKNPNFTEDDLNDVKSGWGKVFPRIIIDEKHLVPTVEELAGVETRPSRRVVEILGSLYFTTCDVIILSCGHKHVRPKRMEIRIGHEFFCNMCEENVNVDKPATTL